MADQGLRGVLGRALQGIERTARRARWAVSPPRRMSVQPPTKVPSSPPSSTQVTRRAPRVDVGSSHPEFGISIELINSVFREAEQGRPWRMFDLYEGCRRFDGHLRGLVEAREMPVVGKSWVLVPGDSKPGSRKAAEDLSDRFKRAGARNWIKHQHGAVFQGPAVSETVWDVVDGIVAPQRFVHVPPRRLAAPSMLEPDVIGLVNDSVFGTTPVTVGRSSVTPLSEYPGRFSTTVYELGNPWVCGLFNTTTWWAAFKRWGWRDWQVFAEMFGLPLRVGYYEEGASEASRVALEAAVEAIGTDGYAVLSDLCELVVKNEARSGDAKGVYDNQIGVCEAQMSKLIIGGTLTTDAGGNGSYAQASVHANHGFNRALADAGLIADTFHRDIATPFVAWNDYGGAAAPLLVLQVVLETSLNDRSKQIQTIATALPDFEFDEDQLREDFAFRKPAPGKGLKGASAIKAAEPPAPPAGGNDE